MPKYEEFESDRNQIIEVDPEESPIGGAVAAGPSGTVAGIPLPRIQMPQLPAMPSIPKPNFNAFKSANSGLSTKNVLLLMGLGLVVSLVAIVSLGVSISKLKALNLDPYPSLCTSAECSSEASEVLAIMNKSVDPCDDFYAYACGRWSLTNPQPNSYVEVTQFTKLQKRNEALLKAILNQQTLDDDSAGSAERKVKSFYKTCTNDYATTANGGDPLIKAINGEELGGWATFYSFKRGKWNFNKALQTLHAKYGVNPFFKISVSPDVEKARSGSSADEYGIELNIPDLGIGWAGNYLYNNTYTQRHIEGYKTYIKDVVGRLWDDLGKKLPNKAVLLDRLINDVMYIETQIANIDWFNLLQNYFSSSGITRNRDIRFHEEPYITGVVQLINGASERQLNNYMMWKLIDEFDTNLGWDYVHAARNWAVIRSYGYVSFLGIEGWCFQMTKQHFGYALDSMFVKRHFGGDSNQQDDAIAQLIKSTLISRIDQIGWMDADTKRTAIEKLRNTTDNFGYPDWLNYAKILNDFYSDLPNMNGTQFDNMVNLKHFETLKANKRIIKQKINKQEWPESISTPTYYFYRPWNQIFFSAGILQRPFFDVNVPMYMNFGAMGRLVGTMLIEALDSNGKYSFNDKVAWWSTKTQESFADVAKCHTDLFVNQTFLGLDLSESVSLLGRWLWREVAALQLAFEAHRTYVNKFGRESALPGLQTLSDDQALLLSFAQTFCYNRNNYYTYWNMRSYSNEPEAVIFPKLFSMVPQVRQAFNCPSEKFDNIPSQKCDGF